MYIAYSTIKYYILNVVLCSWKAIIGVLHKTHCGTVMFFLRIKQTCINRVFLILIQGFIRYNFNFAWVQQNILITFMKLSFWCCIHMCKQPNMSCFYITWHCLGHHNTFNVALLVNKGIK